MRCLQIVGDDALGVPRKEEAREKIHSRGL